MNLVMGAGLGLSVVGFAGYVAGIWVAYPARSFSVTALMVGITLAAIGRSLAAEGDQEGSR